MSCFLFFLFTLLLYYDKVIILIKLFIEKSHYALV